MQSIWALLGARVRGHERQITPHGSFSATSDGRPRSFEDTDGEERRSGVGFPGVGSRRVANLRQIHGQWPLAASRVLSRFGRRPVDTGDRREFWRALQNLFGAKR